MKSLRFTTTAIFGALASLIAIGKCRAGGIPLRDLNGDGGVVILAFGDSITVGTGDGPDARETPPPPAGYPIRVERILGHSTVNGGAGGERTSQGRARLPSALAQVHPDFVILFEGVNNTTSGHTNEVIGDLQAMVDTVFSTGALPILGTLTPTCCDHSQITNTVRDLSNQIRSLAAQNGIPLADFFAAIAPSGTYQNSSGLLHTPEGLHPTPAGYDAMAVTAATLFAVDSAGLFRPDSSVFFLRNSNTTGISNIAFPYGAPGAGWMPLAGDWDGDGVTTIGVYDPPASAFYLRNSNNGGNGDVNFPYGAPGAGWRPIVGDWDGDGVTTAGVFDPATSTFYLRNSNTGGVADVTFVYGPANAGWVPLAGDWDGDGVTTIGLFDPATNAFRLRNSNTPGFGDLKFVYAPGGLGGTPVAGDWNGDGVDTIGIFYSGPSQFSLRNSNSEGGADLSFGYGLPGAGWQPVVGNWSR